MVGFELVHQPFPERKRLGVRIIDAKNRHALLDPELEDAFQLFPQVLPVFRFEIEWIDVLIFLWRILGVLYGAVRTPREPFRMLLHVRMVRRALERDIERDFDVELARACDET